MIGFRVQGLGLWGWEKGGGGEGGVEGGKGQRRGGGGGVGRLEQPQSHHGGNDLANDETMLIIPV